jgi:hypothetical protein
MFFCDKQEQGRRMNGLSWWAESQEDYERLFEASAGHKALGEASPLYLHDSGAARRIKEMIPKARLICSLRDPCERAFSEYVYRRMRGAETRSSFLDAIRADQKLPDREKFLYLEQGLYYRHLTRYLKYFPKERIKILFQQDFRSDSKKVAREVFEFLDVDPSVMVNTEMQRHNSGIPKNRALSWLLSGQQSPLRQRVVSFLPPWLTEMARKVKDKGLQPQRLKPAERAAILPFFIADIEALEQLTGRQLCHWKKNPPQKSPLVEQSPRPSGSSPSLPNR